MSRNVSGRSAGTPEVPVTVSGDSCAAACRCQRRASKPAGRCVRAPVTAWHSLIGDLALMPSECYAGGYSRGCADIRVTEGRSVDLAQLREARAFVSSMLCLLVPPGFGMPAGVTREIRHASPARYRPPTNSRGMPRAIARALTSSTRTGSTPRGSSREWKDSRLTYRRYSLDL